MRHNHPLAAWLRQRGDKVYGWPASPPALQLLGRWIYRGRRPDDSNPRPSKTLLGAERLLVIRLDEIGDVVLTTPLLRELRRNLPRAWITLVVNKLVHNLMKGCPYVNEVLSFDWRAPGWRRPYTQLLRAWELGRERLRPRHFDLALVPRWDGDGHFAKPLVYLSGARRRVGYAEQGSSPSLRDDGPDRLLTQVLDCREPRHEVRRSLEMLEFIGGTVQDEHLDLWLTSQEQEEARLRLVRQGLESDDLLITLAPGASKKERQWPVSRFAALGAWLIQHYGARLLVVGGPGEEPLGRDLVQALGDRAINLTGQTTLRQAAALISLSRLFVGNDSGPMHLAAAGGVPVVELCSFSLVGSPQDPRSPARFGPWGVPQRILHPAGPTPPCTEACLAAEPHCILGVTVARAQEAAAALLAASREIQPVNRDAGVTA